MATQPTIERAVTLAPKGKPAEPIRLEPVPFLFRQHWYPQSPFGISADGWRNVVARSPIVALCRRTLTLEVTATPWKVVGDDPSEVQYYEGVIGAANGESLDLFLERLIDDILSVPFGGATEVTRYRDGTLALFYHVDGGTLFPTYDDEYPFVQIDPENANRRQAFSRNQLARVMWAPLPDMRNYGWSRTPVMDVFTAVEALMRSDTFYGQFLSNTPEAGILDLMDMSQESAQQWLKSWQELMLGIDPLKIPVLYEHEQPAKFLSFSRAPAEIALPEIVKRYAEQVCAAFGMNIGDLGLFEHTNTLAGTSRMLALSKRQGLGSLMRKLAALINSMLPATVEFQWDPLDEEDRLRKAQAKKVKADTLKILATVDSGSGQAIFPLEIIRKQAVIDGLIDVLDIDDVDTSNIDEMLKAEAAKKAELEAAAEPPEGEPEAAEEEEAGAGELSGEELQRHLHSASEGRSLPRDLLVYRGLVLTADLAEMLKPGTIFTDPDESLATTDSNLIPSDLVLVAVRLAEGQQVRSLSEDISEVTFPAGASFRVEEVYDDGYLLSYLDG